MKERLKRTQLSLITGILSIVGLFAAIILTVMIVSVLADLLKAAYFEFIEYALFIVLCILIIRKWIVEYEYCVIDDSFTTDRYIGKTPKRILSVSLSDISYIGKNIPRNCTGKPQRLTFKSRRRDVIYIVYGKDKRCAYLSPSKKMLDMLNDRLRKVKDTKL